MSESRHVPGVRFPIQGENVPLDKDDVSNFKRIVLEPGWVPWAVAEIAYRAYCKAGHGGQSLERLAERGGFGWFELIAGLRGDFHSEEIGRLLGAAFSEVIQASGVDPKNFKIRIERQGDDGRGKGVSIPPAGGKT